MANGDIAHADVEAFIKMGQPFPSSSETTMTETEADSICNEINADVNLILKRLAFSMPISDSDSLEWIKFTKLNGASAIILDGLLAQDSEEGNTRAQRYWDRYMARLNKLVESGGEILQADRETDPQPNRIPTIVGEWDSSQRKRFLRFPQRAAADHHDNDSEIASTGAGWKSAIRGL
jgi:hypothetical protein